jgi:hypothetical protein
MTEKPVPPGMIRCVFVDGPLDGQTTDVDAYMPWQTPPESIDAEDDLNGDGVKHRYVRESEVEDRPGIGRHLSMRYEGARQTPPRYGPTWTHQSVAEQVVRRQGC